MEKDSLNEFMWILVITLLGATLLIFSSPFGDMLKDKMTHTVVAEAEQSQKEIDLSDDWSAPDRINYGDTE